MNHLEREEKLRQIISGFFHFKHKGKIYKYIEPSASIHSELSFYTAGLDEELKKAGFLSAEDEKNILIQKGLWSEEKELELDKCREKLESLSEERIHYKFQSKHLKVIESALVALEKKIEELAETRNSMFLHTIEYQRMYRINILLLSQCVKDTNNMNIWKDVEDLENNMDVGEIDVILRLVNSKTKPSTKVIRELARNEPWRTVWKTSVKTGSPLFRHPTSEMTKTQYELCYWSNVYDSVYESSEYPGQSVIEDDDALDEWFIEQSNKHNSNKKKPVTASKNKKIANASEVFIKVDTPEDAQKVYDELNNYEGKATISKRSAAIDKSGDLSDDKLPDISEGLRIEMNKLGFKKQ